jgi:hypothetical protein
VVILERHDHHTLMQVLGMMSVREGVVIFSGHGHHTLSAVRGGAG